MLKICTHLEATLTTTTKSAIHDKKSRVTLSSNTAADPIYVLEHQKLKINKFRG